MKKEFVVLFFISLMFCIFSCKDMNNATPSVDPTIDYSQLPTEEGFFIDAPTFGLHYKAFPSGMSGITDKNGKFSYKQGDEVTFFIGNMQIGFPVKGKRCISPLHIAKANSIYGNHENTVLAQNIIRFLMALNTGKNPYGLIIPHIIDNLHHWDLHAILCSPHFENEIIEIIAALRDMLPAEIVLPTIEEAQKHFLISESLIKQLEEKAGDNLFLSIKVPSNFKNHYIDFAFNADNFENSYFSGKKILVNNDSITKYSTKLHSANWQLTLTALQNNNRISENDLIAFYTNEGFSSDLPEDYTLEIAKEPAILHADLSENAFLIEETFIQNGKIIIPKTLPDETSSFLNQDTSLFFYVDILTETTNTRAASFELIIPIQKEQWEETEVAYEIPFSTTLASGFKYKAQVYFKPDSSKTYYVKQAQTLTEETGDLTYTFTNWDEE